MRSAKKKRTSVFTKTVVDFAVEQFSCKDDSVLSALNKHSKEFFWSIRVGDSITPLDVRMHVDKSPGCAAQVKISCEDRGQETVLFPQDAAGTGKLKTDFVYSWPFRGIIPDIDKRGVYELKCALNSSPNPWHPARVLKQRPDGNFEVACYVPDGMSGEREVYFPAVPAADLREAATQRPVRVPERALCLEVPQEDPVKGATLKVDGEFITHYFARPSPSTEQAASIRNKVIMKVDKNRTQVVADIGNNMLQQYLNVIAQQVSWQPQKLRTSWRIGIGPWAEHTIEVEKKYKSSKVVTLTVDGATLVESAAEDIDVEGAWRCEWNFNFSTRIDFQLYETNRDAVPLDSTATVTQVNKCAHRLAVVIPTEERDLSKAQLYVNDVEFKALERKLEPHPESDLRVDPEVIWGMYRIKVPYQVNLEAPAASMAFEQAIQQGAQAVPQMFDGLFNCSIFNCCSRPTSTLVDDHVVRPARPQGYNTADARPPNVYDPGAPYAAH